MSVLATQLQAQLEAILRSEPQERAVAVRMESADGLPESVQAQGSDFEVHWCESRLAMRQALTQLEESGEATRLLLVTPIADSELPADIAARLARARIFQAREWEVVRPLFGAASVDVRLGRHAWMAQALIDLALQGPYAEVPGRFLDLDTAWREFLSRGLGLSSARPDAMELLAWTLEPEQEARLAALPEAIREDVLEWFARECGPVGQLVAAAARSGRRMDALPIAIVCGTLFANVKPVPAEIGRAAIRLERYLAERHVPASDGQLWAKAAAELAQSLTVECLQPVLERSDAILRDLRIGEYAFLCAMSPMGLNQRMDAHAEALVKHVAAPSAESMADVEGTAADVLSHLLSASQSLRAERVIMARRLARWLMRRPPDGGYAELVAWQADEGAFVDWARFRLLGGDEHQQLSAAYAKLRQSVTECRESLNRRFGKALHQTNQEGSWQQGRALPLEQVLEALLSPLMASHPVLLLVMDGMSMAIFRELLARPEQVGWREVVDGALGKPWIGTAALPTVTESSRGSLLCGKLRLATAPQEKTAFAAHPFLLQQSGKKPPVLFHKAGVLDDTGLSGPLREAIADPGQRIVGAVYNAIDDHLAGPEQLHQSWRLDQLRGLIPMLRVARDARRVLVITSDHGHVLEEQSSSIKGGESDRWRPVAGHPLREGELLFEGGRVLCPSGGASAICLVDEGLRYTGRKNGYHGGVSLQEVCLPLSVLLPFGMDLVGWQDAPPPFPEWWELPYLPQATAPSERPRAQRKKARLDDVQPSLFGSAAELPHKSASAEGWIVALLASPTYIAQKQLAARVALSDDAMRSLLSALDERGGKLSWSALAQRMKLPELRLHGALSAARRVLNVDQSPIIEWDEASRTVVVNGKLLDQQFGLNRGVLK